MPKNWGNRLSEEALCSRQDKMHVSRYWSVCLQLNCLGPCIPVNNPLVRDIAHSELCGICPTCEHKVIRITCSQEIPEKKAPWWTPSSIWVRSWGAEVEVLCSLSICDLPKLLCCLSREAPSQEETLKKMKSHWRIQLQSPLGHQRQCC